VFSVSNVLCPPTYVWLISFVREFYHHHITNRLFKFCYLTLLLNKKRKFLFDLGLCFRLSRKSKSVNLVNSRRGTVLSIIFSLCTPVLTIFRSYKTYSVFATLNKLKSKRSYEYTFYPDTKVFVSDNLSLQFDITGVVLLFGVGPLHRLRGARLYNKRFRKKFRLH